MKLEDFRRDYVLGGLTKSDLDADPIKQFELWMEQILKLELKDPTAMVLATVDTKGQPTQRIVLLKHFSKTGFEFYTNKSSAKAQSIVANPHVGLHFPWNSVDRQVKVEGKVEDVDEQTASDYFASRPRQSQLAAWASEQSEAISSRDELMQQYADMEARFPNEVPKPENWGGYRVVPELIEFWQGGAHRLHDRFVYQKQSDGSWAIEQLQP